MSVSKSAFFERSCRIAEGFLQTAVVIDDRAFRLNHIGEPAPAVLSAPPTPSTILTDEDAFNDFLPSSQEPESDPLTVNDNSPHALNAQEVIESFANRGIICSVLQRAPETSPAAKGQSPRRLLDPADILIIDWQVHREDGSDSYEETLEFLEDAVRGSAQHNPEQLRITIVYTGALDLLGVAEQIEKRLNSIEGVNFQKDGSYAFRVGASRIVVLGKPSRYRTAQDRQQQVQSDADLADRVTKEFAAMTSGLVSNVILKGLTEIRRATHRILSRFPQSIDGAFLAHRTLLNPPAEGNEHLIPLLCAEIQAILEAAELANEPSDDAIFEWLAERLGDQIDESSNDEHRVSYLLGLFFLAEHGVDRCLRDGIEKLEWLGKWDTQSCISKLNDDAIDSLPSCFHGKLMPNAHAEFSELMALRPRYGNTPPTLNLGTILEKRQENSNAKEKGQIISTYWLCLQPLCDCVRLTKRRAFPLIPLREAQGGWFSVSISVDGVPKSLRIVPRVHETQMVAFNPSKETKSVIAEMDASKDWYFPSPEAGTKWRWLGELKFDQAQRAVQAYANQSSRVGLTEAEWQRRKALR